MPPFVLLMGLLLGCCGAGRCLQAVRQCQPDVLQYFDYGTTCHTFLDLPRACNQAVYGQLQPPVYDLTAITTPLVLFTGVEAVLLWFAVWVLWHVAQLYLHARVQCE